jgi:3',5'-nucleoside bisphosphate phosphatase
LTATAPGRSTPGRRVDLHTHTRFSDGALGPEELLALASRCGVGTLAITDHDSTAGLARARAALASPAAPSPPLDLIPGIEVSSAADGHDLHILGYFVDSEHPGLVAHLERFHEERRARAQAIVERLAQLGAPLDLEQVFAAAGPGVVGRPHIARALLDAGHVFSMEEAFRRYLGPQGLAFVPRPAFPPARAIEMLHAAGGLSVLAHPGGAVSADELGRLVDAGLRGVEVWHPQHGQGLVRRWRDLARQHGLLETGGTDFHEPGRGLEPGGIAVPPGVVARLKEAAGVAA